MACRVAIGVVGIAVAATPVLAQEPGRELEFGGGWSRGTHAQEKSSLDLLVGGGLFLTDDNAVQTGEVGVITWLSSVVGLGVRHSLRAGEASTQLTSVTLNVRAQTSERVHLLLGWSPVVSLIQEYGGWEVGIPPAPLVDVFIRYELPHRRFDIQVGVNIYAREGAAWIHPMALGVFSF